MWVLYISRSVSPLGVSDFFIFSNSGVSLIYRRMKKPRALMRAPAMKGSRHIHSSPKVVTKYPENVARSAPMTTEEVMRPPAAPGWTCPTCSRAKMAAPLYSPPVQSPWQRRQITKIRGAMMPRVSYPGKSPIMSVWALLREGWSS